MRSDNPVLVEQGQPSLYFQHPLNHEHHVRPTSVIFVEDQRDRALQRPWQHAFAEFGHLATILQDYGVLAHEVDTADVAVQIDPHQWPVQARGYLLDVGRLACPVVALDHHASVMRKACADGQRGLRIKAVGWINFRRMRIGLGKDRNHHVRIYSKQISNRL